MTWRTMTVAVAAVILTGTMAWAAVCPLCFTQIPDGEKFCARHKTELVAKQMTSQDEQKVVAETTKARGEYKAKLEALAKFYDAHGNAESLRKVQDELKDLAEARCFDGPKLEDTLHDLAATTPTPEADKLLKEGDSLRNAINPFNRAARLKEAATKYQEILIKYPKSTAVDSACFGLGEIYSTSAVGEPARAVKYFELAYLSNTADPHDAIFRAAQVSADDLSEYESAARYYWMASKNSPSTISKKRAAMRLKEIQKAGFGATYVVAEEKPADTGKGAGEKK